MPPKRKRGGATAAAKRSKKQKKEEVVEEEEAGSSVSDAIQALKKADKAKPKSKAKVDAMCSLSSGQVHEDFDCMLNQTNIGHNNNKFYIIQVIEYGGSYYCWNRWGRVGEPGANALKGPLAVDAAIADFKKKFKDKTRNAWDTRANFNPVPGKYTLLEMDGDEGEEDVEKMAKLDELDGVKKVTAACTLDKQTQSLVKLLFDNDMFKDAMKDLEIDVKKMPLGKLSKTQIAKGFEVLEEIDEVLKKKKKGSLADLTSRFYTLVPHAFGRMRPPVIEDEEHVRKKMDMLMVLADIELAQSMQKTEKKEDLDTEEVPHPLDAKYGLLQSDMELVDKKSQEFKILEKYLNATQGGWSKPQILDVWKVSRHGEDKRFTAHEDLTNRKLLWHGTNVAVVAAIMKSGLRIMPHSGGRVGKGIYFASENGKSAGYVSCASGGIGIMFLNEVALGKEHHIKRDDWRLTAAPKGYDSIVAKGSQEPDPKKDTSLTIDGNEVTVPQGAPIPVAKFSDSNFSQSEYLIYKESQNRIRYLLKMKM